MNNTRMYAMLLLCLVAIVCLATGISFVYAKAAARQARIEKQEELSIAMGVSLEKYPGLPDDYFSDVLTPRMSLIEVHQIVVGYERVFHDSSNLAHYEIYYYFSDNDLYANRIMIVYDQNFLVRKIVQEDENSETLSTVGWAEGLLVTDE